MNEVIQAEQLLADSMVALMNMQLDVALESAQAARKIEPNNAKIHQQIGFIYMNQKKYDEAIKSYNIAVRFDPKNGNHYFDLGYAYATINNLNEAIKNLAKAEELGCSKNNYAKLYQMLGMACYETGRYDDALINFSKAQQHSGINLDILQRKAIIYLYKKDIRNTILAANQMKLISPSKYAGYQIVYNLLKKLNKKEEARKELERAKKYIEITPAFYLDCAELEVMFYEEKKDEMYLHKTLNILDSSLKLKNHTIRSAVKCYLLAAEIYLQLNKPEETIQCLKAAASPASSYNDRFDIFMKKNEEESELTESALEEMLENDLEKIREYYGEYGMLELEESFVVDENGDYGFLTDISLKDNEREEDVVLLKEEEEELTLEEEQQLNSLYMKVYKSLEDYEKVIYYAKLLQRSPDISIVHSAKYEELEALEAQGDIDIEKKYLEAIKWYERAVFKDPSDVVASMLRVNCYIKVGNYIEAERVARLFAQNVRQEFLSQIEEAKKKGGL